ncbi:hypothetical protein AAFF_G00281890 [Aldrovandia affinis]|uniref:Uncharacterized protein n=1 Tax=Aldrovandia affinis TaxID=143900 RepID=A0AAD7R9U9_9TELE|nr:hypothetical protein AAFF_G00281890 [Aldrovandia affinis]
MPVTSEIHASANDNDKETKVTVTGTQPPSLGHATGTVVVNSETEGSTLPVRKRRNSIEFDHPNMSGGTPAPSEAGSSVQGYESAHKRSQQKVSWWLRRSKTERSVSSGYRTRSSVVSEAKCKLEKDSVSDIPH